MGVYNGLLSLGSTYCCYSPINESIEQTDDTRCVVLNIANTFFSVPLAPKDQDQ